MELEQKTIIKVVNEGTSPIIASSKDVEYTFEASNDGVPYELDIPFSDVKFINQKSCIFKEGYLSFSNEYSEEEKEQLYKELYITKWRDILTYDKIENIIKSPTKEGLNKLLAVSTFVGFERIKGVFTRQLLIKGNDISIRVKDLINARAKEISEGKLITSLIVKEEAPKVSEVTELKDQIKELQEMIAKMSVATKVEEEKIETQTQEQKKTTKKSTKIA